MNSKIEDILFLFEELEFDPLITKNTKIKITEIKSYLEKNKESKEMSSIINKILNDLEIVSEQINIPAFIRSKIWQISSLLESIY